jgi:1A family penicillin-binding protein
MTKSSTRNGTGGSRRGRVRAWLRARPGMIAAAALLVGGTIALVAGIGLGTWNAVCRDCPSIAQIYVYEPQRATRILDVEGRLVAELFVERRTPIELATLPEYVPQAFVAIEDRRFYQHDGLDYIRILGAGVRNVLQQRVTGGASTITQQLARNMFTEEIGFERRALAGLTRKLKEARVAREIEDVYTKDQILEAYINQVNYGHGWHGIETAAQHYFGKPAVELNVAEAAMLAAAVNAPGRFSPFVNPDATLRRRNLVLSLMSDQGYLSAEDAQRWRQEPLPDTRHGTDVGRVAPYFVEWVRTILDERFGGDLYRRGYQVETTIDLDMQRAAQAAMDHGWDRIESQPGYRGRKYADVIAESEGGATRTPYIQGSLIALDAKTGEVRALIGGRDFNDSKFNRATQALRQPGSVFKAFVYTAAIASGIPASHVMHDAPLMIDLPDGNTYSPRNYDPGFRGPLTLRAALRHSVNTIAVQLGMDVGLETVAQTARQMGLRTPVPAYPSMPIGAADVVPLQITEAFSPFANEGVRVRARPIVRVLDADGRVVWQPGLERDQVIDPKVAAIMRDLLQTALNNGTGYPARNPAEGNLPYEIPGGGKTGTTNDATDVWFVGFTPDLVASVWFGFDQPQRILPGAAGGRYAAPVWGQFMRSVYYGESARLEKPEAWAMPEGIVTMRVDSLSGRRANEWCPDDTYVEYFIEGTEPAEACEPARAAFRRSAARVPPRYRALVGSSVHYASRSKRANSTPASDSAAISSSASSSSTSSARSHFAFDSGGAGTTCAPRAALHRDLLRPECVVRAVEGEDHGHCAAPPAAGRAIRSTTSGSISSVPYSSIRMAESSAVSAAAAASRVAAWIVAIASPLSIASPGLAVRKMPTAGSIAEPRLRRPAPSSTAVMPIARTSKPVTTPRRGDRTTCRTDACGSRAGSSTTCGSPPCASMI